MNQASETFLRTLQADSTPRWTMPETGRDDTEVDIRGLVTLASACRLPHPKRGRRVLEDLGHLIRFPLPRHPTRLVVIAAGRHSIGTQAACLAVTAPPAVRRVAAALGAQGIDSSLRSTPFWVLLSGRIRRGEAMDAGAVDVIAAGGYERRPQARRVRPSRGGAVTLNPAAGVRDAWRRAGGQAQS